MNNGITDIDDRYGNENGLEDDSSDYISSDEDNAVKYMPDGELARKKSSNWVIDGMNYTKLYSSFFTKSFQI